MAVIGDPRARERWARRLFDLTGWDIWGVPNERDYVSRLWAEDWDSPEDCAYDELPPD